MKCRLCPTRKYCWDVGNCESCDFGKAYEKLNKKNKNLKKKNDQLKAEIDQLKEQLEILRHPNF